MRLLFHEAEVTISLSSIYKGDLIVSKGKVTRVINTNELIAKKMKAIEEEAEKKRLAAEREEYKRKRIEEMREKGEIPEGEEGEQFIAGIMAEEIVLDLPDGVELPDLEEIQAEEEALAESAAEESMSLEFCQEQVEKMLAEATAEATRITDKAYEDADLQRKLAYDEGLAQGIADGEAQARSTYEEKLAALEQEREELHANYEAMCAELEPALLDTMLDIISQAFVIDYRERSDMLLAIIDKAVRGIKDTKSFKIRVCDSQLDEIRANKEHILERAGGDIAVEIVGDTDLKESECFIEADSGVYECSLDVQLSNLVKELKILSLG